MAMMLPTMPKVGPKWKLALTLITLWALQAFWVWAVNGSFLTPDVWAAWWIDRIAGAVRWADAFWRTRNDGAA